MGEHRGCGPLRRYHFSHKQGTLFLTLALALKGSAVVPLKCAPAPPWPASPWYSVHTGGK